MLLQFIYELKELKSFDVFKDAFSTDEQRREEKVIDNTTSGATSSTHWY